MIAKAVFHTKGTGGPSHLDVDQFRHILLSKKFKTEVKELRKQPAAIARTLALTIVDLKSIKALTNCRLIPFNKNSSVRPIGIGKVFRKFIGKAINWILKDNIQQSLGLFQTANGLKVGTDAAIIQCNFFSKILQLKQ